MPITAFLYGHYACPHSYIAQGRLDLLASEAPVRVVWRPLPPVAPAEATEAQISKAAGWSRVAGEERSLAETLQSLRRDAAGLGLTLSLPSAPPDPRRALQAAEFARDCGAREFERLHRALFRAVFVDERDIQAEETLLELAEESGVDREGLAAAFEDARYEPTLREVEAEAERYGIDATPTILLGRYKLVGAAPLEVLGKTLERALADAEGDEQVELP